MKRKKALALAAPSYAANQNLLTLRKQRKCPVDLFIGCQKMFGILLVNLCLNEGAVLINSKQENDNN